VAEQRKVVTAEPENSETPLEGVRSWVTPTRLFFVRNHFAVPPLDLATWRLHVEGRVKQRRTWTWDELNELPDRTVFATVECAGNRRSFLAPRQAGVPWGAGAVGHAEWTGVPLALVLERSGLEADACEVLFARSTPTPNSATSGPRGSCASSPAGSCSGGAVAAAAVLHQEGTRAGHEGRPQVGAGRPQAGSGIELISPFWLAGWVPGRYRGVRVSARAEVAPPAASRRGRASCPRAQTDTGGRPGGYAGAQCPRREVARRGRKLPFPSHRQTG
jgi:hypothetical protein